MAELMDENASAKQEHDDCCDVEDVEQIHRLESGKRFVAQHVNEFHDGPIDWIPF